MYKYNLFKDYSNKKTTRKTKNFRTIENKIISTYRDKEFFDGDRINGYGGYIYDGRWKKYAKKIIDKYHLNNNSKILQINCEKGFILNDILEINPKINVYGTENSHYAIDNSLKKIKKNIQFCDPFNLPYRKNYFDFVLAVGVVYTLNLTDIIKCLNEIQRVSKDSSFINLASYDNEKDYKLFKDWSLLGATYLKESEWLKVLKHVNYKGHYYFTNAGSLGLK